LLVAAYNGAVRDAIIVYGSRGGKVVASFLDQLPPNQLRGTRLLAVNAYQWVEAIPRQNRPQMLLVTGGRDEKQLIKRVHRAWEHALVAHHHLEAEGHDIDLTVRNQRFNEYVLELASAAPLPSPEAVRLLEAQAQVLVGIVQTIDAAGAAHYRKEEHRAWYVFPTTKPGASDHRRTGVMDVNDVRHVLDAPTCVQWAAVLLSLANVFRKQGHRNCLPWIDHGRVIVFLEEWTNPAYTGITQSRAPEFASAVDAFRGAWNEAKRPSDVGERHIDLFAAIRAKVVGPDEDDVASDGGAWA